MAISGQAQVVTPGTAVALTSSQKGGNGILIKALTSNTGIMYVGSSTVSSTTGYPLSAGQEVYLEVLNLESIFVDASVGNEKVAWILVKP
jgi:hypothetical protein